MIYISRRDHFRQRDADPAGNLRVHFDLQMKNIIPWTIPNENFKSRLLKRVKHVCKGIAPKRKPQTEQNPDQVRFQSLSIDDQLRAVLAKGKGLIFSKGFRLQTKDTEEVNVRRLGREPADQVSFEKFRNRVYENIRLIARNAFTKTEFHSTAFGYKYFSEEESANLKEENSIYLYALLQSMSSMTFSPRIRRIALSIRSTGTKLICPSISYLSPRGGHSLLPPLKSQM